MKIDASNMHFQILNEMVRQSDKDVTIENCIGQRYIGSGQSGKHITINGTPGNALGAYLNGADITVWGNAQDATGDTMNEGAIVIHGSSGDATGYAMRGGKILVEGDAGYRAGIHMKSYQNKIPVLMIGGRAGSFLGEYQAGGIIIVLGLDGDGSAPVGNFCGTGMHGGKMYLRCRMLPKKLPGQIVAEKATEEDMAQIDAELDAFCRIFDKKKEEILAESFYVLTPNTKNPYKQLYTYN
ncbi:glutamate synthase [Acetivibrio sp. MSJd-27]|uniref:GltB/FmdC/FwdC-like GXGXG domain-containing protein n=1 Tax=Acetivibrio sp. MSJd-27 TaxID=2841523 RepID=UPI001C11F067|nr:glutamate synthase [Acetivibrio sp. MSJd-27]MBU5451130.1 glutamate synthase [Acetivibrio sp. MSJd-27]